MYKILCNIKGSKSLEITEEHLQTIENHFLFSDLLDSNGIVDENILGKLKLNVQSLLNSSSADAQLVTFCKDVLFHDWMKAFGLHQLILLYIDWQNKKIDNLKSQLETEAEV